jgi:molybdenum-dependent DNA-binding transcriptional regulator ModE
MLNTNEKIIKHKVGLLNLAEELGNVSKACKVMGLSRDTFYLMLAPNSCAAT